MEDRFLHNSVSVKIWLVRSKDAYLLIKGANLDYKVRIVDAVVFVRNVVLNSTVAMAHIQALDNGTAMFPLRPVDCKLYSIPQGAMSSTHQNASYGGAPTTTGHNGAFDKKKHFTRRSTPLPPLQPNSETGQYARSYVNLFSATGKHGQAEGTKLTRYFEVAVNVVVYHVEAASIWT